ncbi:recombinase family protein [Desulfitobacterium sp.]|uniref:recombinase family protein n=1 Tax=Desulfitobacterium sp. TaxID=49981 RepID=UPI002B8B8E9B|nr:recombinase family protein [Desulfitobacterium sp.]HVJ49632.1 recombinase family protein [Desulfitobacterium sp.]
MVIGQHVVKGMVENASKRDPETGYCYKNGGRAPYGYRLNGLYIGKGQRKDNYKLLWEKDPETAPILQRMVVDWRIGEGLSYHQIRDRLNEQNIPNPSGTTWISSSISQMFREDRLMQYAGYYYWNKTAKRGTKGQTRKDKSESIIVENAHSAIISVEEVKAALALARSRQPRTAAISSFNSRWALTGLNLEGQPFFTCKCCGGNMSGLNDPRGGKYACSNYHYRGEVACTNQHTVRRPVLEKKLLQQIEENFGEPEVLDSLMSELNSRLNGELESYHKNIKSMEKELNKVEKLIDDTFTAFAKGLDPDLCNERLTKLKAQREELNVKMEKSKKDEPKPLAINTQKAKAMLNDLKKIYENGTNEQKRTLFKTYIRRMQFDPETNQVDVVFYTPYVQEKLRTGAYLQTYIADDVGNAQNVNTGSF